MGEEYIAHSGTEGMKWYNRRYQYPDGTYTELGKARRRVGNGERRPMLTEEEKKQRRIAYYEKKEAINHGDILYASKHLNEFSNQELDDIADRYFKAKRISDIVAKIEGTDKSTTEKIAEKLKTVANIAESSATIAKSLDTIHRSVHDIGNRGKDDGKKKDNYKKKDDNKKNKKNGGGLLSKIAFISKKDAKGEDVYQSYNRKIDERSENNRHEDEQSRWRSVDNHFDNEKKKKNKKNKQSNKANTNSSSSPFLLTDNHGAGTWRGLFG